MSAKVLLLLLDPFLWSFRQQFWRLVFLRWNKQKPCQQHPYRKSCMFESLGEDCTLARIGRLDQKGE